MGLKKISILVFLLIVQVSLFAESELINEDIIIESFNSEEETPVIWKTFGSKFSTDGYPIVSYKVPKSDKVKSYSITGSFTRNGFNYLEIIPGELEREIWIAKPLSLPGLVESITLWVYGSSFNNYLELHLIDDKGVPHRVDMGSIKHIGWKKIYVKIPEYINQMDKYRMQYKGLELARIVVRTDPEEIVDSFDIFLKDLYISSNTKMMNFDNNQ